MFRKMVASRMFPADTALIDRIKFPGQLQVLSQGMRNWKSDVQSDLKDDR